MFRIQASLFLGMLLLLSAGAAAAAAAPCPPHGTTFPSGPFDFKIEPNKAVVRIVLSQLPETRLVGVVEQLTNDSPDNSKPSPIALVWDPLEAPRLGYDLTLDKGQWRLSFRSDPLYRTAEASTGRTDSQRVSLSYRAVTETAPDDLQEVCKKEFRPIPKATPASLDGWTAYPGYVRLQPANLMDYIQSTDKASSFASHKQDIIVAVYWRRIVSGVEAERLRRLQEAKAYRERYSQKRDNLGVRSSALNPFDPNQDKALGDYIGKLDKLIITLEQPLGDNLPIINTVSAAINRMGVSEGRSVAGRSLSDTVPQVVTDLFSIIAEIAFDRAKTKSFSILSERATRLVCTELTGANLRQQLAKMQKDDKKNDDKENDKQKGDAQKGDKSSEWWWVPNSSRPLLPETCETVRGLRIQELATAGKVIYAALLSDITAMPLLVLQQSYQLAHTESLERILKDASDSLTQEALKPAPADRVQRLNELKTKINGIKNSLPALREPSTSVEEKLKGLVKTANDVEAVLNAVKVVRKDGKDATLLESLDGPLNRFILRSREGGAMVLLTAPLLRTLAVTVQRYASGGGALDERDLQLAFLAFAKDFAKLSDALLPLVPDKSLVCPVRLALAVVSECQSRGGCDAGAISSYLQAPEQFLSDEQCSKQDPKLWPAISVFISRAIEVVRPTRSITSAAQLHNITELVLDVAEFALSKQQDAAFPFDAGSLASIRSIFIGAVDQEAQKVLIGFSRLLTAGLEKAVSDASDLEFAKALHKFSALSGAVASYAQNYPSSNEQLDEKQAKALREARKKSIESMMEITTDRTARGGAFIVSLGINPGFVLLGGQLGPGATGQNKLFYTQLTLPTGIALQWLPPRKHLGSCVGGHLQFSIFDLAQFVSFDGNNNLSMNNLRWADFVMAGLQGGLSIGCSPTTQFFVGADVRYSPTLSFAPKLADGASPAAIAEQDQQRGVFRAGLTIGYYVPFFDFN